MEVVIFPGHLPPDVRHLLLEWCLYAFLQETDNSVYRCYCVIQTFKRFLEAKFPKVLEKLYKLFAKRTKLTWKKHGVVGSFLAVEAIVKYAFGVVYDTEAETIILRDFFQHLKKQEVGFPKKNCSSNKSYYARVFNFGLMRYQVVWFEDETKNAQKNIVPLKELLAYLEK